ncbi:MAG TPA: hypothetical protein VGO08_20995 [Burkholderiales bacterium]|jgi:hypothetical protein|nr:hypothetical protein [Burkholderiales bacterium]
MTRDDIEALRIPLIALVVTLILTAGVVYFSANALDNMRRGLTQHESQLREARLRIQNAGEEKEMIARYLGSYQQLARAGFVGEEQRINWLDSLRIANEEAGIFGVEYDISAQRPYAYASEFNAGQLLLQESLMRLRFTLLHEEDLPRFFNALGHGSGGFFTIDHCVVRRLKFGDAEKSLQVEPHLAAECELRWLTVKPGATAEKKG